MNSYKKVVTILLLIAGLLAGGCGTVPPSKANSSAAANRQVVDPDPVWNYLTEDVKRNMLHSQPPGMTEKRVPTYSYYPSYPSYVDVNSVYKRLQRQMEHNNAVHNNNIKAIRMQHRIKRELRSQKSFNRNYGGKTGNMFR